MARRRKKKQDSFENLIGPLIGMIVILGIMKQYGWAVVVVFVAGGLVAIKMYVQFLEIKRLRESGILDVDQMDGHRFEEYLVQLFTLHGYDAVKTKGSGDYGADLILKKAGRKIVVQAKRQKSNVNLKAVQEVIGGKGYYNAQEAWVVTNSTYAESAIELAKKNGVKLIQRNELMKLMEAAKTKK